MKGFKLLSAYTIEASFILVLALSNASCGSNDESDGSAKAGQAGKLGAKDTKKRQKDEISVAESDAGKDDAGEDAGLEDADTDGGSAGCDACTSEQYCQVNNCGRNGEKGTCSARPSDCASKALAPVCGCDGVRYYNPCAANKAGFAVDNSGECTCPSGFGDCDDDPGNGCETDLTTARNCGECGKSCGVTACIYGKCTSEPLNCGSSASGACPTDQYCDYASGDGCDMPDGKGVCRKRPQRCSAISAQVCGCDNKTYSSACHAALQGASVRYEGRCETEKAPGEGK